MSKSPERSKAYLYWGFGGPIGLHAFYCKQAVWGGIELTFFIFSALMLYWADLDFTPLINALSALQVQALDHPLNYIVFHHPSFLMPSYFFFMVSLLMWGLDLYLIWRWTEHHES